MSTQRIALSWSIGHLHGWGVYGLHLVFRMLHRTVQPVLLHAPGRMALHPLQTAVLLPVIQNSIDYITFLKNHPEKNIRLPDVVTLLHSDGTFFFPFRRAEGKLSIGMTFFEYATLSAENINKAKELPLVVTGSSWNEKILKDKYGLNNSRYLMQGVDTSLFFPAAGDQLFKDRFVVFSGGKLEHRKGQDLVIAAFKLFLEKHPEALLVTAWSNLWFNENSRFDRRLVDRMPESQEEMNSWLARYLPEGSFMDIGSVPNPMMPSILHEVDVGLFPNRCEGGTNLVAMECMACVVPVILSKNTGHLDLIEEDRCYVLTQQNPVVSPHNGELLEDWGESSIEEMVEQLEEVYDNHQEATQRGLQGHKFMKQHAWNSQCDQLLDLIEIVR